MSFISRYLWKRKNTGPAIELTHEGAAGLKTLTGRYSVGFFDVEWEDSASLSVPESDVKLIGHELPCVLARIYYPTAVSAPVKEQGTWLPSSHYFPGYGYFMRLPTLVSSGIGRLLAAHVRIHAAENKPLLPIDKFGQEHFPVAIFSHGLGGIRTTYSTICCEMASRGIIVVALEHRDGSASMTIDREGRVFPYQTGPSGVTLPMVDYEYRAAQLKHRLAEMTSTQAFLAQVNTSGKFDKIVGKDASSLLKSLKGRLLLDRFILIGHSFGAGTCLASAQQHPNVKCCIAWDPWMFPMPLTGLKVDRTDLDMMVILNQKFSWPENDVAIHQYMEALRGTKNLLAQVRMLGCGHMDQSDLASIIPAKIIQLLRPGSSTPARPQTILQVNVDLAASHLGASFPGFNFDAVYTLRQLEKALRRDPLEFQTELSEAESRIETARPIVQFETIVNYH